MKPERGAIGRALFVGRFQPFHHGHYQVALRLLEKHDEVIIAIGSAESSYSDENPFTAGERIEMVRAAFEPKLLSRIIIIPVRDINDHAKWVSHVMAYVPKFEAVYSNNELVQRLFRESGIGVKVESIEMIDRGNKEGRYIRSLMAQGNPEWEKHVPGPVAVFIKAIGGLDRIERMKKGIFR